MIWVAFGILALLAVGLGTVLVWRDRRYRRHFAIDLAGDQEPAFAVESGSVTRKVVAIDEDGFVWPAGLPGGSIVLEIEIASSALGRWFDPWIELQLPAGRRRSYLERGARGLRCIHFGSGCVATPGRRVRLRARGLRWRSGSARLFAAQDLDIEQGRTVIVAPHSDDAELAAFSLFGERAWVITVTAGEVGTFQLPGYNPGSAEEAWARAVRRAEDSVAAAVAGGTPAAQVVLLGYFDGTLAKLRQEPDLAVPSSRMPERRLVETRGLHRSAVPLEGSAGNWSGLVRDLQQVLGHVRPLRVVLPHPDLDLHGDHVNAALAVLEAMEALGAELAPCDLLYYANHRYGARDGRNPQPVGRRDGFTPIPWAPSVGEPLYDQPVSVPLAVDRQEQKRQALRGMVDLFPSGSIRLGLLARLRSWLGSLWHAALTYDLCFLRRCVRQDELFFVVRAANAEAHRRRLLRRFAVKRPGPG